MVVLANILYLITIYNYKRKKMSLDTTETGLPEKYDGAGASVITIRKAGSLATESAAINCTISPNGAVGITARTLGELAGRLESEDLVWFGGGVTPAETTFYDHDYSMSFMDGSIIIDTDARLLVVEGTATKLGPVQYSLLEYLAKRSERLLYHQAIVDDVWGDTVEDGMSTLRTHIKNLRRKMGEYEWMIQSRREVGYMFTSNPQLRDD